MSQPVLSSPFSYRLLYKTHKRLNPRSYKPFLSSRIRRKRDQHRRAGSLNLSSISPRSFPLLHISGKADPTSRHDPVHFPARKNPMRPLRGIQPVTSRGGSPPPPPSPSSPFPLHCVFSSAHVTASHTAAISVPAPFRAYVSRIHEHLIQP